MPKQEDPIVEGAFDTFSTTYRKDVIEPVVDKIVTHECTAIVGVSAVGKTHVRSRLTTPTMLQHFLPDDHDPSQILFVIIDPNRLLTLEGASDQDRSLHAFELTIRCILESLEKIMSTERSISEDVVFDTRSQLETITRATTNTYGTGYRALEKVIDRLLEGPENPFEKIVMLFDEFEHFLESVPTRLLLNLRALRDRHRYRLLYIVQMRSEMTRIATDSPAREPFVELFRNAVYIKPLREESDLKELMQQLNYRLCNGAPLYRDVYDALRLMSGGHPGLLRTALTVLAPKIVEYNQMDRAEALRTIIRQLLNSPDCQWECERIYNSLTESEQQLLKQIAENRFFEALPTDVQSNYSVDYQILRHKGLLQRVKSESQGNIISVITPPLLQHYVVHEDELRVKLQGYTTAYNEDEMTDINTLPEASPSTQTVIDTLQSFMLMDNDHLEGL